MGMLFEFETQDVDDLKMHKHFYVDENTMHILWLERDELLCAPIGEDGFVVGSDTIVVDLENGNLFPDLASINCQIRSILLRRRGETDQAEDWQARAHIYDRLAKENPDRLVWPGEERRARDYLDVKKS